jgi:hypothetical protein
MLIKRNRTSKKITAAIIFIRFPNALIIRIIYSWLNENSIVKIVLTMTNFLHTPNPSQRGEWLSEIFERWLRDARHDDSEPSDAIPLRDGIAGNTGKFCYADEGSILF